MENLSKMIGPVKSPKAYLLIVEKIVNLVAKGKLAYGEYLYTENFLMEMLDVSRPTLREALRVLEFLGVVSVSPRKGISINRPGDTNYYLSLMFILMFDKTTNIEIFQLRRAIQVETVATAALVATEKEILVLKSIVERMKENLEADYITFERIDYDFHMQIVVCAHNQLCLKLMQTMNTMIHKQMQERLQRMPVKDRKRTLNYHSEIYTAILNRDSKKAKDLMSEHLEDVYLHLGNNPVQFNFEELLAN